MIAWRLNATKNSTEEIDVKLDAVHDDVTNTVLKDIVDMVHDIKILMGVYYHDEKSDKIN